jgi:hypothetical protein
MVPRLEGARQDVEISFDDPRCFSFGPPQLAASLSRKRAKNDDDLKAHRARLCRGRRVELQLPLAGVVPRSARLRRRFAHSCTHTV